MVIYAKCYSSFLDFIKSDKLLLNRYILKNITKVGCFDISLRDGIQSLSSIDQKYYVSSIKKELYKNIIINHNPSSIEFGSTINNNKSSIFSDTPELIHFFQNNFNYRKKPEIYVLISNFNQYKELINSGINHISLSYSFNSVQCNNTNILFEDNYIDLVNIIDSINKFNKTKSSIKIYISCISKCPVQIITTINKIITLKPNKICLSDNYGIITLADFKTILNGIDINKIKYPQLTLHLHINPNKEDEAEQIVHTALDYGIYEFDVSIIPSSHSFIDSPKIVPIMNYNQYYKFLTTYLLKQNNKK